jgi:hypothetical protein
MVTVYGFDLGTVSEPLTSILSPCSKGRGSEIAAILPELMKKGVVTHSTRIELRRDHC